MRQMTSSLQSVLRSLNATMRTKAESKLKRDSKKRSARSHTTAAAAQADHEDVSATNHRTRRRTGFLPYEFASEEGADDPDADADGHASDSDDDDDNDTQDDDLSDDHEVMFGVEEWQSMLSDCNEYIEHVCRAREGTSGARGDRKSTRKIERKRKQMYYRK